jgi:hypothetical protein
LVQVIEEDSDDLPEAERHDRQVVAAELQRRRAEKHAEDAGESGAQRQDDPEGEMKIEMRRREQGVDIRPDRIERDVAEIEEAGEAHHDVEPQREHDIDHREVEDAHPRLPGKRCNEWQDRQGDGDQRDSRPDPDRDTLFVPGRAHARSLTRSPSSPEGRKMRTRISTKKAKTSW